MTVTLTYNHKRDLNEPENHKVVVRCFLSTPPSLDEVTNEITEAWSPKDCHSILFADIDDLEDTDWVWVLPAYPLCPACHERYKKIWDTLTKVEELMI